MTMENLRENVRSRLVRLVDKCLEISRSNRIMPGTIQDGVLMPAPTMEFMGARAVETNAMIDAYMKAINVLDEEFKRIVDPSSMEETVDDPMDDPDPNGRVY